MKRIKLVIATGIYPPSIGGPATYSKLLYDKFPSMGIDVSVETFDSVRMYPRVISHIIYFVRLLNTAIGKDIILAQDTVSVGLPALCVSKILRKPFFVRVPGDYAWEQSVQRFDVKEGIDEFQTKKYGFKVELLRRIQKIVVRGANKVITPSEYFRTLVSGWGKKVNPVRIYNGVEDVVCIDDTVQRDEIRKTYGYSQDDFVLVSIGRLVPWKGFDKLVEMMSDLDQEIKLLIVGSGPDKEKLENIINDRGLSKRVRLTGQVSRNEVFETLNLSDVFILNTFFESFSFQVVEAMKVGLPIITTSVGSLPELVTEGENGFLVEPDDITLMKKHIKHIMSDYDLRQKLKTISKKKSASFGIDATLDALRREINKTLYE